MVAAVEIPDSRGTARVMGLRRWCELVLGVALFLVGSALFFKPNQVPGDLGDSRFNMYVLEHGYRWLIGLDPSFWSAPFYYPAPKVISYSDNHLGTLLFYSGFRLLGQDRETAFQLWAGTIFALNYFVTWIVLRKQNFHLTGAIAAAYLFTFPFIIAAQASHLQLAPRFMVPVAFWMAWRFLEEGQGKHLRWLLLACAYQIYLGIYIGYFLLLSLGAFFVFCVVIGKRWNDIRNFFRASGKRAMFRQGVNYVISGFCFVLVMLPLAVPYCQTQQEIGRRAWSEVTPMLPRWQSYLYAPASYLWGDALRLGESLSHAQENALFLGLLPLLAVLIFACLLWTGRLSGQTTSVGLAMIWTFLFLSVITFSASGCSLYWYLWRYLPGAGGIRAVTRCALVAIYPLAFIFGAVVSFFMTNRNRMGAGRGKAFLGLSILTVAVADQAAKVDSVNKQECQRRILLMKAMVLRRQNFDDHRKVLWVNNREGNPFFYRHLDAMLAAQDLNLKVINGYSGLAPNGYSPAMFFLEGDCCADLAFWVRTHPGAFTKDSLLQIGSCCQVPLEALPFPGKGFGRIEFGKVVHVWAVDRVAELRLAENPGQKDERVVSFDLATWRSRLVRITGPDEREQTINLTPGPPRHVEINLLPGKAKGVIKFQTDGKGVRPHGENRTLFFDLENLAEEAIRPGD